MRTLTATLAACWILSSLFSPVADAQLGDRVRLRLDTIEAAAVLTLLAPGQGDSSLESAGWQRLFGSEGYVRLHAREAAMHRGFHDTTFARFVRSDSVRARRSVLRPALEGWARADLTAAARRALAYVPADARIVATVYVMIKPRPNSFVWEAERNAAIFLYLDPDKTPDHFANIVAHELHHVGFSSVQARSDSLMNALPDSVRPVWEWVGAFGEGFAMLAAAGGPDIHPHAVSPVADRARWDADMAHFSDNLRTVDTFFHAILTRRLATPDTIESVGMAFFGIQGPWYTVGWRMAVLIERQFGRAELIQCMTDRHRLLERYNDAAAVYNRSHRDTLALWSPDVVTSLDAHHPH